MASISMGADSGGREAIERLLKAYGLKTKQSLSEQLGVSKSTMSNRLLRDSFPADWVIQCALETGVSLLWLATGHGEMYTQNEDTKKPHNETTPAIRPLAKLVAPSIKQVTLENGTLIDNDDIHLDHIILPNEPVHCLFVNNAHESYVVDQSLKQITNGLWLVDIDGVKTIVKLTRLPGNKLAVHQDEASFECAVDDIEAIGRAVKVIKSI
ncbi:TPA: phage repressor protein CI [Enterobacter asburiae]|nr:phage repressor protein CI [Enterobacter asburiae]